MSSHYLVSDKAKKSLLNSLVIDLHDIAKLSDLDLAETLLCTAITGRLPLLRALLLHRDLVPVVFSDLPDSPASTLSVRNYLEGSTNLRFITNSGDLKALFSSIHECGMKGLIEPGSTYPLLLRDIDTTIKRSRFMNDQFSGELPDLRADTLSQPELAIALHEDVTGSYAPDAYKPLLCWASKDMVRQFPEDLRVLTPFQTVNNQFSMQDWKENYNAEQPVNASLIKVGVNLTSRNSEFAESLFSVMAPDSARLGLPDSAGRVLCETTTDFLLSFPAVNHSAQNAVVAKAFVAEYCPFEIIALQADSVCVRDFGHEPRGHVFEKSLVNEFSRGTNELLEKLSRDNPLRDQVLNMMQKEQWLDLIKNFNSVSASVKTLLALRDTFGIDNTGLPVYLYRAAMVELINAGYRFADETKVFDDREDMAADRHQFSNRSSDVMLEFDGMDWQLQYADQMTTRMLQDDFIKQYQQIMSTNLWPAAIPKPPDVKTALELLVVHDNGNPLPRENSILALRAYLVTAGLEACIQEAASEHWDRLMNVFGKEAFQPYIKTLPHKARGLLLEDGMGL
jgi:hypothetical protein